MQILSTQSNTVMDFRDVIEFASWLLNYSCIKTRPHSVGDMLVCVFTGWGSSYGRYALEYVGICFGLK
jgi:hypothetical protein